MAASHFFEDINEYKTDIGLTKGKNPNEEETKVKPMKAKGVKKKVKTFVFNLAKVTQFTFLGAKSPPEIAMEIK